jgi:hypothetical protein
MPENRLVPVLAMLVMPVNGFLPVLAVPKMPALPIVNDPNNLPELLGHFVLIRIQDC